MAEKDQGEKEKDKSWLNYEMAGRVKEIQVAGLSGEKVAILGSRVREIPVARLSGVTGVYVRKLLVLFVQ